ETIQMDGVLLRGHALPEPKHVGMVAAAEQVAARRCAAVQALKPLIEPPLIGGAVLDAVGAGQQALQSAQRPATCRKPRHHVLAGLIVLPALFLDSGVLRIRRRIRPASGTTVRHRVADKARSGPDHCTPTHPWLSNAGSGSGSINLASIAARSRSFVPCTLSHRTSVCA